MLSESNYFDIFGMNIAKNSIFNKMMKREKLKKCSLRSVTKLQNKSLVIAHSSLLIQLQKISYKKIHLNLTVK